MENIQKLTLTRREAAAALGVGLPTLDAFLRRRDNPLPCIRSGDGPKKKLILIPRAAFESWILEEAQRNSTGSAARR